MNLRLIELLSVLVFLLMLPACSDDTASDCEVGHTQSCECPDGTTSAQTCGTDGTYGSCACSGDVLVPDFGSADSGTDVSEPTDAGDDASSGEDIPGETGGDVVEDTREVVEDSGAPDETNDVVEDTPLDEEDVTPDDTGSDSDVDTGCIASAQRCNHRIIEECDSGWFEREVCTREEMCRDGACVDIPAVYGTPCRGDTAYATCDRAGFDCMGPEHIPFCRLANPMSAWEGSECLSDLDCPSNMVCARFGWCQDGRAGDKCSDDDDCADGFTCVCREAEECNLTQKVCASS